jgi:hypothetical protein
MPRIIERNIFVIIANSPHTRSNTLDERVKERKGC